MDNPYRRLAVAIIRQAIIDLHSPSQDVRARAVSFLNNSASLRSWCTLLSLDPPLVIATISKDIYRTHEEEAADTALPVH
jgi:hypothetical protein